MDIGDLAIKLIADPGPLFAGLDQAAARAGEFATSVMDPKRFERVQKIASGGIAAQVASVAQQTERTDFQATLVAQGRGAGEVSDAMERFASVQKLANQLQGEGETRAQALSRASVVLAEDLGKVAKVQEESRAAAERLAKAQD